MIRKLTTLTYPSQWDKRQLYRIRFDYYDKDEFGGLKWTGDSESCELTEDELYELVKPMLKVEHPYKRS